MASDEIVVRAQAGDVEAFEELVRVYTSKVKCVVWKITKDSQVTEDLCQRVWMRVYRRLSLYRHESAFGSWLHQVAKNEALYYLRVERKHARVMSLDAPVEIGSVYTFAELVQDKRIPAAWRGVALRECVEALPYAFKQVILLHKIEGLEFVECAQVMEVAVGTAKAYYTRAREQLKEFLVEGIPMHARSVGQRKRRAMARAAGAGRG